MNTRLAQLRTKSAFHLSTIYGFTKSDMMTIVVPTVRHPLDSSPLLRDWSLGEREGGLLTSPLCL